MHQNQHALAFLATRAVSLAQASDEAGPPPLAHFSFGVSKLKNQAGGEVGRVGLTNTDLYAVDRLGQVDGAMKFTKASESYFQLPVTAGIQGSYEFTVSMWINPAKGELSYQCLMSMISSEQTKFFACLKGAADPFVLRPDDWSSWFNSHTPVESNALQPGEGGEVPRGEWSFITITRQSDGFLTVKRHPTKDGPAEVLQTVNTQPGAPIPEGLPAGIMIGNEYKQWPIETMPGSAYVGLIDDVKVFDTALSEKQSLMVRAVNDTIVENSTDDSDDIPWILILSIVAGVLLCLMVVALILRRGGKGDGGTDSMNEAIIPNGPAITPAPTNSKPAAQQQQVPVVVNFDMEDL